jgi:hypothetical protein
MPGEGSEDSSPGSSASSGRPLPSSGGAGADPTQGGDGGALPAGTIPPPLSEEEINAMDEAQLRKALNENVKARKFLPSTDTENHERLKREFNQILARLREVPKGGG